MGPHINIWNVMSDIKGYAPEPVKRETDTRVTCMVDALKHSETLCAITMRYMEIGRSSGIDDKVVQDQRQRDDNDLQDERQDQPRKKRSGYTTALNLVLQTTNLFLGSYLWSQYWAFIQMDLEVPSNPPDLCIKTIKAIYGQHGGIDLLAVMYWKLGRLAFDQFPGRNFGHKTLPLKCSLTLRVYLLESERNSNVTNRVSLLNSSQVLRRHPRDGIEATKFADLKRQIADVVLSDHNNAWVWSPNTSKADWMAIDTNVTAPVNVTGAPVTNTVANHAEKPETFNGQNFKRSPPLKIAQAVASCVSMETFRLFECHRLKFLNGLVDDLYNAYCKTTTAKELWESLECKYKTKDVGTKRLMVACFLDYKMVDSKNVITQVQDLRCYFLHDILLLRE
ncbi:hypothetical protein Tco_0038102 [Tanacetum coccineum]